MDRLTGIITLNQSNIFDYERQSLVTLQIQAKDTLTTSDTSVLHTAYCQLLIQILDINDETPVLTVVCILLISYRTITIYEMNCTYKCFN